MSNDLAVRPPAPGLRLPLLQGRQNAKMAVSGTGLQRSRTL